LAQAVSAEPIPRVVRVSSQAMSVSTTSAWCYAKTPEAVKPKAGDIYELQQQEVPALKEGMILVRLSAIAVAPMARAFLELPGNDTGAEDLGLQRLKLGGTAVGESVATVVETMSKKFVVGDRVWLPFNKLAEHQVFCDDGSDHPMKLAPVKLPALVNTETFLSTMTPSAGVTAYVGANHTVCGSVEDSGLACLSFLRKATPKTVLVTSAAGAVGIVACQLYKHKGCKVIGVTSTREKVDKLLAYGCDAAIAYKTEDLDARLSELAPEKLDVVVDNVGSTQLDAATKHMKIGGKILSIGTISELDNYATGNIQGWKNYHWGVSRELKFEGLYIGNHQKQFPGAMMSLGMLVFRGKIKPAHTIIEGGFEEWAAHVDKLFGSETFGRMILVNSKNTAGRAIGA